MSAYCTIEDVAALLGVPVEQLDADRVDALIGMATGVLSTLLCDVPEPTPEPIVVVTASIVARQTANPNGITSEQVSGYRVQYASSAASGLMPTDDELALLEPWLCVPITGSEVGTRAYTIVTPLAGSAACWPYDWWQRDLDQLDEYAVQPS